MKRGPYSRGRNMPRSRPYVSWNYTKDECVRVCRVFKRKSTLMIFERHANLKYKYGNRHFWCRGYYVDTVGKKCKKDWRVYSKSVEGRFGIWSDVYERVYWPVYGWAGNQKQEKVISPRGLASSWCCGWRTFRWVFRLQHREWALIGRKTNHRLSRWWWFQWVIS